MRILFLTQIIPYPPDAGPKVKTWHVLRYLVARGHEVILASFVRPEEQEHVKILEDLCAEVHTVPIVRSRIKDAKYWLQSHFTNRPFLIERDDLNPMRKLVGHLLATKSIDVIHADQLTMTQFAFNKEADQLPYTVFDAHNAVWTIVERMQQNAAVYLKPVMKIESRRIKRYEGMIIDKFNHTLAVTSVDRQALLEAWTTYLNGSNIGDEHQNENRTPLITTFPITVDTEKLTPIDRQAGSKNIMTMGTLHYPPNADGVRWFVSDVYPLIKNHLSEATLTIVGKNPPQDLIQLAAQESQGINITGYVPDLKPYMEAAALMVVPVRAGSGMRVRILEAFARAMPVITTTVGLEGIEANIGKDVLVQDTSEGFASAVVQLLEDEALQAQLASNGRRVVQERYDWKTGLKGLDNIYEN
jgi:glycosyltransferase involved in cell wall biosynthesis